MKRNHSSLIGSPPRIGILGGLGPYGHIALEINLMRERQALARSALPDQKFPTWVVLSQTSIPDRTRCIETGRNDCKNQIIAGLKFLLKLDTSRIVIPCVTAHHWAPEFEAVCKDRFENIITHTLNALARRGISRLAILGTAGTVRASVFSAHAERLGHEIEIVFPRTGADFARSDVLIGNAISRIKAAGSVDEFELRPLIRVAREKNPQAIILGCTELSYVASSMRALFADWLVVDPLQIISKALLASRV
jgi:aspartate racemase